MLQFFLIDFATPAYDETIRLRDEILRQPLGLQFNIKDLEVEYSQYHLGAYDAQGTLVACLVLKPLDDQVLKMRQVAVKTTVQGKGYGSELVKASETFAIERGFQKMELNARDNAIRFYERMGYRKIGKPFTGSNDQALQDGKGLNIKLIL